ncbi:MAG: hypothetical protein WAS56_01845, partial [Saprospiraceae bacterium]
MLLQLTGALDSSTGFMSKIIDMGYTYLPKLIGAVLVYLIGSLIIKWICGLLKKALEIRKFDPSLQSLLY